MSSLARNFGAAGKIYEPLPDDHIRLVTIHPAKYCDDYIDVSLQNVQASAHLSYEALSYVWGSSSDLQIIWVNGTMFWVTENLHLALTYLRHKESDRILWIDAIAINQMNTKEKTIQVRKMHQIYQFATQTIAWLGAENPPAFGSSGDISYDNEPAEPSDTTGNVMPSQAIYSSYWGRIWVVQEAILSQQIVFQCGSSLFKPHTLRDNLEHWQMKTGRPSPPHVPLQMLSFRDMPFHKRILDFQAWARNFCPQLQCENLLDKVFGFFHLLPKPVTDHINLQYGRSVVEVYTEATWHFINHEQALRCLDLGDARKMAPFEKTHGLPTWVPDYDVQLYGLKDFESIDNVVYAMPTQFYARLRADNATLCLKGLRIGSCTVAQNSMNVDPWDRGTWTRVLPLLQDCSRAFGRENVASDAFLFAFGGHCTRQAVYIQRLRSLLSLLEEKQSTGYQMELYNLLGQPHVRGLDSDYALLQFTSPLDLRPLDLKASLPANAGFGIGFWHVKAQDEIWMIAGCKNPIILRWDGDRYKFIGNSFIPELAVGWFHPDTAKALEQLPLEDVYLR